MNAEDLMGSLPCLDIIIVNWNAGDLIGDCLESVASSDWSGLSRGRVVIVDNGSSDGSTERARSRVEGRLDLTILENASNQGFASACDQGAAAGDGDYILFLNPDVRLEERTLASSVTRIHDPAAADVGIVGIRLTDEAGRTQRCCARLPTPGAMIAQMLGLDRLSPRLFLPHFLLEWDHENTRDVPQVMGAFLLTRRSLFEALGGFDERFFVYYEDVDLCRRAWAAGARCVYLADVRATHIGCGTTRDIKALRQFYAARSRILYAAKTFGVGAALAVALACLLGEPAARGLFYLARGDLGAVREALRGAGMLWRALPKLNCRPTGFVLRVLTLCRYDRMGASSRLRFLDFSEDLRKHGVELIERPFFDADYLRQIYAGRSPGKAAVIGYYLRRLATLLLKPRADVIWLEKEALPYAPGWLERLLLGNLPRVVDFDDAWYLRYAESHAPLIRMAAGEKFGPILKSATVTTVGNRYLEDWALRAGAKRVTRVPTVVRPSRYRNADPTRSDPVVIGWIGTPTTAPNLRFLLPILDELTRDGRVEVRLVGAPVHEWSGAGRTVVPWSEDTEAKALAGFSIGIMPLEDNAWNRGKCAYKLIQYMAAGLPVVASPIGMNREVVAHGETGFLASSVEEWREALTELCRSPETRSRMSARSRAIVEGSYSTDVVEPILADLMWSLVKHPPGQR